MKIQKPDYTLLNRNGKMSDYILESLEDFKEFYGCLNKEDQSNLAMQIAGWKMIKLAKIWREEYIQKGVYEI